MCMDSGDIYSVECVCPCKQANSLEKVYTVLFSSSCHILWNVPVIPGWIGQDRNLQYLEDEQLF